MEDDNHPNNLCVLYSSVSERLLILFRFIIAVTAQRRLDSPPLLQWKRRLNFDDNGDLLSDTVSYTAKHRQNTIRVDQLD